MADHAWHQRENESAKAYEAFLAYCEMGRSRSHAKVAQKLGKSRALINRWGAKHGWASRVESWDELEDARRARLREEIERETAETELQRIKEINNRHAALARAVQSKIIERIGSLKSESLSASSIAGLLSIAVRIEREAHNIGPPAPSVAAGVDGAATTTRAQDAGSMLSSVDKARLLMARFGKVAHGTPGESPSGPRPG